MKKWILISSFAVVVLMYAIGYMMKIDLFLPLWGILIISGVLFYLSDGMSIRAANSRNYSFLDINKSELDYAESTRRKAGQDKSLISSIIVTISSAVILCLIHCYLFPLK